MHNFFQIVLHLERAFHDLHVSEIDLVRVIASRYDRIWGMISSAMMMIVVDSAVDSAVVDGGSSKGGAVLWCGLE